MRAKDCGKMNCPRTLPVVNSGRSCVRLNISKVIIDNSKYTARTYLVSSDVIRCQ